MNCPIDGTELKITDRQGVEIDYCPQCRGVWLDRGELDKIIERADQFDNRDRSRDDDDDNYRRSSGGNTGNNTGGVAGIAGLVGEVLKDKGGRSDDRYRDDRSRDDRTRDGNYRKKKKGGILGELFDF